MGGQVSDNGRGDGTWLWLMVIVLITEYVLIFGFQAMDRGFKNLAAAQCPCTCAEESQE
jgi:hypothetical protein